MKKFLLSLIFSTIIILLSGFELNFLINNNDGESFDSSYIKNNVKDSVINSKFDSIIAISESKIKNDTLKDFEINKIDSIDSIKIDNSDLINLGNDSCNVNNEFFQISVIDRIIVTVKNFFTIIIKTFFLLLIISLLIYGIKNSRVNNQEIKNLKIENLSLRNLIAQNKNQINFLKSSIDNLRLGKNTIENFKATDEIKSIKSNIIEKIKNKNKLIEAELSYLTNKCENRWVTLGHSATGSTHLKSIPPIPCQDSHYFESLENDWILSVVCDGAGSAKLSNLGSNFIAKIAIPMNLKSEISNLIWFKSNVLPSETEWFQFVKSVFSKSLENLKEWILKSEYYKESEKDFATTVIFTIHNIKGILCANIGDGRGGFLNVKGELKPLFEPFKGDESNSTVFLTSPIWEKPKDFIKTKVINENPLSVFILSDGLEKISFKCSLMIDGIWLDPNIPYRDFFYPIFKNIKGIPKEFESRLPEDWKYLLENGSELIRNESDDKTMIISFLK